MQKQNNIPDILFKWSLFLLFSIILIPNIARPFVLGLFGLSQILKILKRRKVEFQKETLIISAIFLLFLFSIFYSEDKYTAIKMIGRMSPVLIAPIFFGLSSKKDLNTIKELLPRLLRAFSISVVLFFTSFFIYHLDHYGVTIFTHYPTLLQDGLYRMHPLYAGLILLLAIVFSTYNLSSKSSNNTIITQVIVIALLFFFLLLMVKKSLILILGAIVVIFALRHRNKKIRIIFFISAILLILCILATPKIRNKFSQLFTVEKVSSDSNNSVNIRYTILDISLDLAKDTPFFGFGIGDSKSMLNNAYLPKYPSLAEQRYNSHNQYLSILFSIGYFGLFIFLMIHGFILHYFIKYKNILGLIITFIFATFMLLENILEREVGIFVYSIFLSFFILINKRYTLPYKTQ